MEETENCSVISSDSNSTIIDETYSKAFSSSTSKNIRNTKTCNKNMYDLNEFEHEDICEITTNNKKNPFEIIKSEEMLKELSQKYLPKKYQNEKKFEEVVLLSNSSSEDDYNHDNNTKADCNKTSLRMDDLDKNNTVFENFVINSVLSQKKQMKPSESSLNPQSSSSSEEMFPKNKLEKLVKRKLSNDENNFVSNRSFHSISSESDEGNEKPFNCEKTNTKRCRPKKIVTTKTKIAAEETNVRTEKAKKKEQLENEKTLKQAQRAIEKYCKPEECLKYIIVNMDNSIFNHCGYGDYLKEQFTSKDILYKNKTSLPGVISWTRKILIIENMAVKEKESEEKHFAVVIKPEAFGNIVSYIKIIKEQTDFHHLSIFVYGQSKPTSSQEDEILEVEMFFPTYWQFVNNKEELSSFIIMLTKSISQIQYKLLQEEKYNQQAEYLENCNKNLVKVDKDGNGLGRLWRQMLTMFPLVRLETAEAITAFYPTLSSIFEAYENSTETGEQLVENLPIRRAQGPLASSRRLGPELSKKCYTFFTSEENVLL